MSNEPADRCGQHLNIVRDVARLQSEVEHMNKSITESVALQKEIKESLTDKLDTLSEKVGNPELSKAWIIGAFSLCCGIMTMFTGIIVVVVNNADKIGKLLGWS